ncbi:MAG: hypothetical protein ACOCV1_00120 [Bacillota bacterium]
MAKLKTQTQEPSKKDAMNTIKKFRKMGRKIISYDIKEQTTRQGLPYLLTIIWSYD